MTYFLNVMNETGHILAFTSEVQICDYVGTVRDCEIGSSVQVINLTIY